MVSVVVACRNEAGHIASFLDSLARQDAGVVWEVIIADGMSTDATREILARHSQRDARIRIIDNPGRIVSTGLNAAIRAAGGEIIVRMDAHTEYAPDYIRRCVEVLEATGADNVGGPPRVRADGFRTRLFGAAYHSAFAVGGSKAHDLLYEGPIESVFYGCWRKTTLLHLDLFDESLVRNQDDELNLRLIRSGGKIWQSPRIVSWYNPRTTARKLFRQQFQYGFWKVAVIRKHRIPASWRHVVPGAFVLAHAGLLLSAAMAYGSPWSARLLSAWALLLAGYAATCVIAAAVAARRPGWAVFPLLALIFPVYHFSYGIGFLAGMLYRPRTRSGRSRVERVFTEVSR